MYVHRTMPRNTSVVCPAEPHHFSSSSSFANCNNSSEHAGTARLNCLNLGLRPGELLEALWQLRAVKEQSLAGLDGAKRLARCAANVATNGSKTGVQRAVLLSLLSVALEGRRKLVGGCRWVSVGRVVNLGRNCALAQETDHGLAVGQDSGCVHCDGRIVRCGLKWW